MENPIDKAFDSRCLIEYFEELEQEIIDYYNEYLEEIGTELIDSIDEVDFGLESFTEQYSVEIAEYKELKDFVEELESCSSDFRYGEMIIRNDYWEEYCEELLTDIGYIPKDFPSWIVIDWEATAVNLAQDYSFVIYNGEHFYIRST